MVSIIEGVDEIRNSSGELFQIGTIGFGHQSDWEVIHSVRDIAAAATHDFFWDDQIYDEIEIVIVGAASVTDDRDLEIQLSSDGSTFHAGASDYRFTHWHGNSAGSAVITNNSSAGDTSAIVCIALGDQADEFVDAIIRLPGVSRTDRKQQGRSESFGVLLDTTMQTNVTSFVDLNTDDSCRGFRLLMESAGSVAFDAVYVRGRRTVPVAFTSQDDWVVLSEKIADDDATIEFEPADFDITQYDQFEIDIIDAVCATNLSDLLLTVSDDGGATYEATTYAWAQNRWGSNSPTLLTNETSDPSIELIRSADNGAGEGFNAHIKVNALDGVNYKIFTCESTSWSADDLFQWLSVGSWRGDTTAINGIRFAMDTGNITSGKFRLRGRRKAPVGVFVQRWIEATLQTTGVTEIDIATVSLADGKAKAVRGFIVGTEAGTANFFTANFIAHGKNDGGTSGEGAGAPVIDKLDASPASAWDFDVDVDDTTDTIRMRVTGEAATTIDWRIQYEVITEDNL